MDISVNLIQLRNEIPPEVALVAVTKTKPVENILQAYDAGQRIFGENKIQEMEAKWQELPKDIEWHMIGHVQTNKVKYMAPFVSLVHAVDSLKLLREINKQAKKNDRKINCLLQIKIAEEDTKYGMAESEAASLLASDEIRAFQNIKIIGLMGMATFTQDQAQLTKEFYKLKKFYDVLRNDHDLTILSMGMSADYELAIKLGSNMIRVGSKIFGERIYNN